MFREHVGRNRNNASMVIGGWQYGGFFKIHDLDKERDGTAINQALVLDSMSVSSLLDYAFHLGCKTADPETQTEEAAHECAMAPPPIPPIVLALDASYDQDTFQLSTSWTEGWRGAHYVLLEELMIEFYEVVGPGSRLNCKDFKKVHRLCL